MKVGKFMKFELNDYRKLLTDEEIIKEAKLLKRHFLNIYFPKFKINRFWEIE